MMQAPMKMGQWELPAGWIWTDLEGVSSNERYSISDGPFGSNLKLSDYVEQGIPVLQGQNITGNKFDMEGVRFISYKKSMELRRSWVITGDILMVKIGTIGYSAVIDDLGGYQHAVIPANLAKISPGPSVINTKYLAYWLRSSYVTDYLLTAVSQTAQPALSLKTIRPLPVPLPPLEEQKRIAGILNLADEAKKVAEEQLEAAQALMQASLRKVFASNKLTRCPTQELSSLCREGKEITYGVIQTGVDTPGGVPVIRAGDISPSGISLDSLKKIDPKISSEYQRTILNGNEIVISIRGSVGYVGLVTEELTGCNVSREVAVVDVMPNISKSFVFYLLRCPQVQMSVMGKVIGSAQQGINLQDLRKLSLPVPSLSDQIEIVEYLNTTTNLYESIFEHKSELEALQSSLLSKAFTGEL